MFFSGLPGAFDERNFAPGISGLGRRQHPCDRESFYTLLGVQKHATPDEIKKAYHRAAMTYHPDKGGDEATFKRVRRVRCNDSAADWGSVMHSIPV